MLLNERSTRGTLRRLEGVIVFNYKNPIIRDIIGSNIPRGRPAGTDIPMYRII